VVGRAGASRRAALAAFFGTSAACTVVTGLNELGTRDGVDAGEDVTSSVDASDGTERDSGHDNQIVDPDATVPPIDSGETDASVPDASTTTWCSSVDPTPRRCLDFDAITLGSLLRRTSFGTLAFEDAGASPPNALLATISDAREGFAYVRVQLGPSPPSRVTYSFDVRVDGAGTIAEFCELAFLYPNGFCAVQPQVDRKELFVNQYCQGAPGALQQNHRVTSVVEGTDYHRFTVTVDFPSRKYTAQVVRPDGPRPPIEVTLDDRIVTGPAELRPGITWAPERTPGSRVLVDNVTVDWE